MFQDGSNETLHWCLSGISSVTQAQTENAVFFPLFPFLVGGKEEILPLDFPCLRTTAKHTASIPRAVCVLREVRRNLSPFLAPRDLGTKERGSLPSRLFPALFPRLMLTRLRPTASNAPPSSYLPPAPSSRAWRKGGKKGRGGGVGGTSTAANKRF